MFVVYFLLTGFAFFICNIAFKRYMHRRKIQAEIPRIADYWREIRSSCITIIVFAMVSWLVLDNPYIQPHTLLYSNVQQFIHQFGWWYFYGIFVVMIIMHDAYFYWTHRLLHNKWLLRLHQSHHLSHNPSPWTALTMHPIEALINSGIIIAFVFILPLTPFHINCFMIFMLSYNIYGHMGYELYPKKFHTHWLSQWINTSVCHNLHHRDAQHCYSLYLNIWDRMMGTTHPDSDEEYVRVTERKGLV